MVRKRQITLGQFSLYFKTLILNRYGPRYRSRYSDSLRAGRSGDRIPMGGGEILRTRPYWPWGPPSLLYNGYRVFPGGKAAGAWRWLSTPSNAEVREGEDLYLYSPSGPSWPVLGWTLPLPFTLIWNRLSIWHLKLTRQNQNVVTNTKLRCNGKTYFKPRWLETTMYG